jgi:hypothetical protein
MKTQVWLRMDNVSNAGLHLPWRLIGELESIARGPIAASRKWFTPRMG